MNAALAMTAISRRTLWRRVADGSIRKAAPDTQGRTTLEVADVMKAMPGPVPCDAPALLALADAGSAAAQNEAGMAFREAGNARTAIYWWKRAAETGDADAMQWLAVAYASGDGVEKDEHQALHWLGKASASGHAIAQAQMKGLLGLIRS